MEMGQMQRIQFLISNFTISKNGDFLRKWQKKNHFFGQKLLWQANKNSFELKMPKFLENHVKTHVGTDFLFFDLI